VKGVQCLETVDGMLFRAQHHMKVNLRSKLILRAQLDQAPIIYPEPWTPKPKP